MRGELLNVVLYSCLEIIKYDTSLSLSKDWPCPSAPISIDGVVDLRYGTVSIKFSRVLLVDINCKRLTMIIIIIIMS